MPVGSRQVCTSRNYDDYDSPPNPFLGGDVEVTEREYHLVVGDLEANRQLANVIAKGLLNKHSKRNCREFCLSFQSQLPQRNYSHEQE